MDWKFRTTLSWFNFWKIWWVVCYQNLGGFWHIDDSIDIYNTISEIFNISRGSATKLYKIYTEDKELFVKVKLPQNPNGTYSIDKAYFSLDSVKKGSVSKRVKEKNYVTMVKNSLPNITTNELFEILKGQNYKEYYETLSEEEKKNQNNYLAL
mgnify:CR=1 FL=1